MNEDIPDIRLGEQGETINSAVALIQCTDSKRDEKSQAKNLYDESDYFCKMRRWARALSQPWFILSAKHGLVNPHDRLKKYDEFGLSKAQAGEIATQLSEMHVKTVYVCAGKKYLKYLEPELESIGIDVIDNFAGMKIGERKQQLKTEIRKLENESLTRGGNMPS